MRQQRLWSDSVDAQADLVFAGRTYHFVGFVMRQLIYVIGPVNKTIYNSSTLLFFSLFTLWTDRMFNQRTSGPVNAHLTPGPGIYFNAFIHVIAPGQLQTTPWGQMLISTESPYHFDHLLQVSNKSLWILILYTFFNVFPHIYSPRAG